MSWSLEEMEAYVRLHKSLAGKNRNKKTSSSKPLSSPKTVAPVNLSSSDVDGHIASHFETFRSRLTLDSTFFLISSLIDLMS